MKVEVVVVVEVLAEELFVAKRSEREEEAGPDSKESKDEGDLGQHDLESTPLSLKKQQH